MIWRCRCGVHPPFTVGRAERRDLLAGVDRAADVESRERLAAQMPVQREELGRRRPSRGGE